jgi:hypothetical protein
MDGRVTIQDAQQASAVAATDQLTPKAIVSVPRIFYRDRYKHATSVRGRSRSLLNGAVKCDRRSQPLVPRDAAGKMPQQSSFDRVQTSRRSAASGGDVRSRLRCGGNSVRDSGRPLVTTTLPPQLPPRGPRPLGSPTWWRCRPSWPAALTT